MGGFGGICLRWTTCPRDEYPRRSSSTNRSTSRIGGGEGDGPAGRAFAACIVLRRLESKSWCRLPFLVATYTLIIYHGMAKRVNIKTLLCRTVKAYGIRFQIPLRYLCLNDLNRQGRWWSS